MRIDVVGRKLTISDRVREHAEKRCEKLERHLDTIQQITFTVDHDGAAKPAYAVELVVDVEHHPNFVAHDKGDDLFAVIDSVSDKAARQLHDFKEKLKLNNR
ncbi:MAG: ribosome-associated translation inhibitor RaiA [Phycisphaerales bacterium]